LIAWETAQPFRDRPDAHARRLGGLSLGPPLPTDARDEQPPLVFALRWIFIRGILQKPWVGVVTPIVSRDSRMNNLYSIHI